MKKNLSKSIGIMAISLLLTSCDNINSSNMNTTNLTNFSLDNQSDYFVKYNDGTRLDISPNYIPIFFNGSIIQDINTVLLYDEQIYIKNDFIKSLDFINIPENTNILELSTYEYINIFDILDINADYINISHGKHDDEYYFLNQTQIIINNLDTKNAITESEATDILNKQLIIAYETKFNKKFEELLIQPKDTINDEENLRYIISNLSIKNENDRFYQYSVMFDFWVDKYTSDIYIYYNGITQYIFSFDPTNINSFNFAG